MVMGGKNPYRTIRGKVWGIVTDGDAGELAIEALEQHDKQFPCIGREPTYYFGVDPGTTGALL